MPVTRWQRWVIDDEDEDEEPLSFRRTAPPPLSTPSPCSETESSVIGDVTVENASALDGSICYLLLKPPIFQCAVGHVVCSPCRDKLAAADRCHVCRAPAPGGYLRCHSMEQLVEAIRVPCPHAAHGCVARPAYHDKEAHARSCVHAPFRCPGGEACGFFGYRLREGVHGSPRPGARLAVHPEQVAGAAFAVSLRGGLNFLTAVRGCGTQFLFLLNVAHAPFGLAVSAVRLHPHAADAGASSSAATVPACELHLSYTLNSLNEEDGMCPNPRRNEQRSTFKVGYADLAGGLPDPSVSFQFFVPKYVLAGCGNGPIDVTVAFDID